MVICYTDVCRNRFETANRMKMIVNEEQIGIDKPKQEMTAFAHESGAADVSDPTIFSRSSGGSS